MRRALCTQAGVSLPASTDSLGTLYLEPGVPEATVKRLKRIGHQPEVQDDGGVFGGYQAILRNPETGVYTGATEMRKDGTVVAY